MNDEDVQDSYRTAKGNVVVKLSSLIKKKERLKQLTRHRIAVTNVNNNIEEEKNKFVYINDLTDRD